MGAFDEIPGNLRVQYYNTWKKIRMDLGVNVVDLPPSSVPVNFWYFGKTGTGKSRSARADFPDAYLKNAATKWWDGYIDQENVIIDDLDKKHEYQGYCLKIWADMYAFVAESKGASMMIRPKVIVVTSNYHPSDIWIDNTTLEPILRRFKVVEFKSLISVITGDTERKIDEERIM